MSNVEKLLLPCCVATYYSAVDNCILLLGISEYIPHIWDLLNYCTALFSLSSFMLSLFVGAVNQKASDLSHRYKIVLACQDAYSILLFSATVYM